MKYGAIAAGDRPTLESALEILKSGGNAFDAAVGAVFTSMTSEFALTSAGGGGSLLAFPNNSEPILFDFFVNFQLDENFNETIKSRHRDDFSYYSFSEGEKKRIDISLLLTWRDIAAMRNSVNVNLLILDEIFDASLDQAGVDDLMKLFNFLKNTNLFIISHKLDVLDDKFPVKITVEKINNFSQFIFDE